MAAVHITELTFSPTGDRVEAGIVLLTENMANQKIAVEWWNDAALNAVAVERQIDRHWDWNCMAIEMDGREIESEKYAIVTGDEAIQGAMMISTEPVSSVLEPGARCLLVELLFTAPWNRPDVRVDGQAFFVGVGTQLLRWAVMLSGSLGCEGRIRLDGSPDYVTWYENRGLQRLDVEPIVFEGTEYTAMELSADAAARLLEGRARKGARK